MSFAHDHTQVLFLRIFSYFQTVETTEVTHNTHSSNIPRAFTIRRTTMILLSSTKLQTNYAIPTKVHFKLCTLIYECIVWIERSIRPIHIKSRDDTILIILTTILLQEPTKQQLLVSFLTSHVLWPWSATDIFVFI